MLPARPEEPQVRSVEHRLRKHPAEGLSSRRAGPEDRRGLGALPEEEAVAEELLGAFAPPSRSVPRRFESRLRVRGHPRLPAVARDLQRDRAALLRGLSHRHPVSPLAPVEEEQEKKQA